MPNKPIATDRADVDDSGWLVALDIDGTTIGHDGVPSAAVIREARRLEAGGHHVMFATGRSYSSTAPVLEQLGIRPEYLVCSNGAVTFRRDVKSGTGYRREWVEYFDPASILEWFCQNLDGVRFALECLDGSYLHTAPVADVTIGPGSRKVSYEDLVHMPTTRLIAMSEDLSQADFLDAAMRLTEHPVSCAVGWSGWVDVSAEGVDKAAAMERVRLQLGVPRSRVMAVGDGRNDVALLGWASAEGRGVAMGGSPTELIAVASELTESVLDDGLALVLATL